MRPKRLEFLSRTVRKSFLARRMTERARTAFFAAGGMMRELLEEREQISQTNGRTSGHSPRDDAAVSEPAATPSLEPDSLAAHLGALVEKRLERLVECRKWRDADDPAEAVHDLRVASRRLRSFVDVFRPLLDSEVHERTEKPLRRITRAARLLRDLDVHVSLLVDRIHRAASDAERAALEHLLEGLEAGRDRADRRAAKRIGKVDFDELRLSISAALGETVARLPHDRVSTAALAQNLIEPLVERAARDRPADDGLEYPDEMHRLRIDLKKLRYGLELFEPVFGERYAPLHECAERIQELLGRHHDLVVLSEVVEAETAKLRRKDRATLLAGLESLHDRLMKERRELLARFRAERFDPDWWEQSLKSALAKS